MLIQLENKKLTNEELLDALIYWQEHLGLQNWQINIIIANEKDMPVAEAQGAVAMIEVIRSATIYILNPDEFDGTHPFNMEQILIHELLHCKMNSFTMQFGRKSKKHMLYEQEVDSLATVLYNLKKKAENKDEIKESGKTIARKLKPGKPQDATE